ncbi:MAG TPA: serine hydrolase [Candidatus Sulfomarinibacteraceae bacterium]|nr:serine hydrolase [Candidatus Sulfomarinibacteraceae bacterium]
MVYLACAVIVVASPALADDPMKPPWATDLQLYLEQAAEALAVPGAAVVVVTSDGATVLTHGVRCVGRSELVTAQTSFGLGSLTKAFTATAAAALVADGALGWDTQAHDLIPELALADPVATERLTLRDLLAHRSGLASHNSVLLNVDGSPAWILPRLAGIEPTSEFRDRFLYSDLGYVLAGEMIGRAAGSSWSSVVSERLLGPLGMTSATIGVPPGSTAEIACGHRRWQERMTSLAPLSLSAGAAGNGLYANGEDMVRWLAFLLGAGELDGRQLVAQTALAATWTAQVAIRSTPPELHAYGFGWYLSAWRGRPAGSHQGGGVGFTSQVLVLPTEDIAVAVLSNRMASGLPDLVASRAVELVLGEAQDELLERAAQMTSRIDAYRTAAAESIRSERDPDAPPSLAIDAYAGCYEHPVLGGIEVEATGPVLAASFHRIALSVEHLADDRFVMSSPYTDDLVATFNVADDTASSVSVTLEAPPPGRVFTRVGASCSAQPTAAAD